MPVRGICWLTVVAALCLNPAANAQHASLRELGDEGITSWMEIRGAKLTHDGQWLTYTLKPNGESGRSDAPVTAVFRRAQGDTERRYFLGDQSFGVGQIAMAESGRWAAVKIAPSLTEGKRLMETGRPVHTAVMVIELSTGRTSLYPDVRQFSFNGKEGRWIALQGYAAERDRKSSDVIAQDKDGELSSSLARRERFCLSVPTSPLCGHSNSEAGEVADLTLVKLDGGESPVTLRGVNAFAFDGRGAYLAWTGDGELHLRTISSGNDQILDATPQARYRKLTWSGTGDGLAVLRAHTGEGASADQALSGNGYSLFTFTGINSKAIRHRVFTPGNWSSFPTAYEISAEDVSYVYEVVPYTRDALIWRQDETGVFIGVQPAIRAAPPHSSEATDLLLWHWRDGRLPWRRQFDAAQGAGNFSYLGLVSLQSGEFLQLADASLPHVEVRQRGRYLLGFESHDYERTLDVSGKLYRDYYVVDLQTGKRELFAKHLLLTELEFWGIHPKLSPDGKTVLYLDLENGGQYLSYDITTRRRRNLTDKLPTTFYDPVNLKEKAYPFEPTRYPILQGWSRDGNYALISDYHDVWALPLKTGQAINLTGDGRRRDIVYVRTTLSDRDEFNDEFPYDEQSQYFDLSSPIYFRAFDQATRRTGLVRREPARNALQVLRWEDANIRYQKALSANVYVCSRETAVEFPDYHLVGKDWGLTQRLTDANPQQREYAWSPGAKLLTYTGPQNQPLEAVLHLPANYVPGRSYPTIVGVYERVSNTIHEYNPPVANGGVAVGYDIPRWTQRGYAVLLPDIPPQMRQAHSVVTADVLAGVKAAIATGIVDPARLGLSGHSYGGYETNLIITQTGIFKAAVSAAGFADLFSDYGSLYSRRFPKTRDYEIRQPYIGGPWWQYWDAYVENSPIFQAQKIQTPLLLIHGDADTAISFSQTVELFNTLRRLGDKPVVMLQYRGEGHVISNPDNSRDMTHRMMEFFDHFLRAAPEPEWWEKGASR